MLPSARISLPIWCHFANSTSWATGGITGLGSTIFERPIEITPPSPWPLTELHGHNVLEHIPDDYTKANFFNRRNYFNSWTERKPVTADAWTRHLRLGHIGAQSTTPGYLLQGCPNSGGGRSNYEPTCPFDDVNPRNQARQPSRLGTLETAIPVVGE